MTYARAALLALLGAACAATPAFGAQAARLRAITADGTNVLSVEGAGATRAYLDNAGTPRALDPDTVLGLTVTAAATSDQPLDIGYQPSLGAFVNAIAGVAAPPTGFWALYVDNAVAQVGGEKATFGRGSEIVWMLDPDFNTPGPAYLDLDVVRQRGRRIVFRVTRVDESGTKPALRAKVRVDLGTIVIKTPAGIESRRDQISGTTGKRGLFAITTGAFPRVATATATLKGVAASEVIRVLPTRP